METAEQLVKIPRKLIATIGELDAETHIYRTKGSHDDMAKWFETICEEIGPMVSPGGAAMYAGVSRPGVYKRLQTGRMTAFCFDIIGKKKTAFGGEKKLKEQTVVYIPLSEAKAWRAELEKRIARVKADGKLTDEDSKAFDEADGEYTPDMHDFLENAPVDQAKRGGKSKPKTKRFGLLGCIVYAAMSAVAWGHRL